MTAWRSSRGLIASILLYRPSSLPSLMLFNTVCACAPSPSRIQCIYSICGQALHKSSRTATDVCFKWLLCLPALSDVFDQVSGYYTCLQSMPSYPSFHIDSSAVTLTMNSSKLVRIYRGLVMPSVDFEPISAYEVCNSFLLTTWRY